MVIGFLSFFSATRLRAVEIDELRAKAEKGDAAAQYEVARRYASGMGVERDDELARQWFLKAAERDYGKAYVSLGSIYSHGFGVKQDWAESIRWFRKAALQGDRVAQHNLGLDYNYAHGVERNYSEAARWYRLGAEQGQPRCQFNLGQLYEAGQGFEKNPFEAFVLYSLAAAHENQDHIFGAAKAKELIERRDRLAGKLSQDELQRARLRIAVYQANVAVNPRQFGAPGSGVGVSRGWFIWQRFDPQTWEAEVSREDLSETWKVRVLPWCTTYRYLNYGVRPDQLLAGERVNMFFNPDGQQRRGYLVHFQDEICQMKGHGHYWQVHGIEGQQFTARVMAGDKVFEETPRSFVLAPDCRVWRKGQQVSSASLAINERIYLTWRQQGQERVVVLVCDDASLDAIKQREADRLQREIAAEGIAGRLESIDGKQAHLMVFGTHWSQAGQLKVAQKVRVVAAGAGHRPQGESITATLSFRKNRGQYGSGVSDMLLDVADDTAAERLRGLLDVPLVRLIAEGTP